MLPCGAALAGPPQGAWCLRTLGLFSQAQQRLLNCAGFWNFLPLTSDCSPVLAMEITS